MTGGIVDDFYVMRRRSGPRDLHTVRYDAPDAVDTDDQLGVPIRLARPIALYHRGGRGRRADLLAGAHFFPVVSQRFREVVEEAGVQPVEFHPVRLVEIGARPVEEGSYWFLNVLGNVAALDWDRSAVEVMDGRPEMITSIERLVLRPEPLRGRDLVRLAEYPIPLLVSHRLRERIERAGLTGVGFVSTAEFRTFP